MKHSTTGSSEGLSADSVEACAPPQTTCPLCEHPEATPGSSCRGHLPGGRGQALAFIHLVRAIATPAVPGVPAMVLKGGSVAVVVI